MDIIRLVTGATSVLSTGAAIGVGVHSDIKNRELTRKIRSYELQASQESPVAFQFDDDFFRKLWKAKRVEECNGLIWHTENISSSVTHMSESSEDLNHRKKLCLNGSLLGYKGYNYYH